MSIKPIILCGGSGTRLWPASRKSLPKQFLQIFDKKSLFDLTIERIISSNFYTKPIIICNKKHGFYVKEVLEKYKIDANIILEPEGKNTTAAIYLAAKFCATNENLIIMPSDHLIPDSDKFLNDISYIVNNQNLANWITLGIKPKKASEAYGYIKVKKNHTDKIYDVVEFTEKPSKEIAKQYVEDNNFFWNSGIFLGNASMILNSIKLHANDVAITCDKVFSEKEVFSNEINFSSSLFAKIPSISIDYSVMEYANNIKLYKLNCEWNDVGSWDSIAETSKNVNVNKNLIEIESKNNFIRNDKRIIATVGVEDLIIIDDDDSTLIAKKNYSEKVKLVVDELNFKGLISGEEHTFENRPWGRFENLLVTDYCKVKKIEIFIQQRLSLQYHNFRSEHWLVVSGTATVYLDGKIIILTKGMSIDIPKKSHHYLHNNSKKKLIVIETQLGTYFGEDDIIRIDDPYKR